MKDFEVTRPFAAEAAYVSGVLDMSQKAEKHLGATGDPVSLKMEALELIEQSVNPPQASFLNPELLGEFADKEIPIEPIARARKRAAELMGASLTAAAERSIEDKIGDEGIMHRADKPGEPIPFVAIVAAAGALAYALEERDVDAAEDALISLAALTRRGAFECRRAFESGAI